MDFETGEDCTMKPCPFCNRAVNIRNYGGDCEGKSKAYYRIECECGAEMTRYYDTTLYYQGRTEGEKEEGRCLLELLTLWNGAKRKGLEEK